jgi:hypothetical protein
MELLFYKEKGVAIIVVQEL